MNWTQQQALTACRDLEPVIASLGMHVALTGGCLYKACPRKDMDIILYRHHGAELCTFDEFRTALSAVGIVMRSKHHNVVKMQNSDGKSIDFILRAGVSWPETECCPEGSSGQESADAKEQVALDCASSPLEEIL